MSDAGAAAGWQWTDFSAQQVAVEELGDLAAGLFVHNLSNAIARGDAWGTPEDCSPGIRAVRRESALVRRTRAAAA